MPVLLFFIIICILVILVILLFRRNPAPTPHYSLSGELERLENLRLRGTITQQEYEQCKQRVLHYPIIESTHNRT